MQSESSVSEVVYSVVTENIKVYYFWSEVTVGLLLECDLFLIK